MPLSTPSDRQPLHTRQLIMHGYQRADGLFDIEGHLIDTKPFDVPNTDRGGVLRKGESMHEMWVRLTIDMDMRIHDAEAVTDWAPFNYCQGGPQTFRKLIGERIGPGWNSRVKELIGGTKGCTHITEMLGQLATTAFQALYGSRAPNHDKDSNEKPVILDTCYGLTTTGPVVKVHWPRFYQNPQTVD